MKRFEAGKTYKINGSAAGTITVIKRTAHYIWFVGDHYQGKRMIADDGLFGMGERIVIPNPACSVLKYFCFSENEISEM